MFFLGLDPAGATCTLRTLDVSATATMAHASTLKLASGAAGRYTNQYLAVPIAVSANPHSSARYDQDMALLDALATTASLGLDVVERALATTASLGLEVVERATPTHLAPPEPGASAPAGMAITARVQ